MGITDKPEMGFEPGRGEGFTQTRNAASNATRSGIPIRAFKGEYVELHVES
jgi:hypothetical protein